MKIKLMVSENRYANIKDQLTSRGIVIDENADLIISEAYNFVDVLIGKQNGEFYSISIHDIIYIESYSHDIIVHSVNGDYKINERLRQLESLLNPDLFLRISNSVIISRGKVVKIKPTLSSKYILTMMNDRTVDVTRSYYYIFREIFGI
ncbi:MAG: LytTR family DNA-binding domain-containing protein [Lachnospiraceae bacterium]